jgi:hypothetical protein
MLRADALRHFKEKSETKGLKANYDQKQSKDGRMRDLEKLKLRMQVMINEHTQKNKPNEHATTG